MHNFWLKVIWRGNWTKLFSCGTKVRSRLLESVFDVASDALSVFCRGQNPCSCNYIGYAFDDGVFCTMPQLLQLLFFCTPWAQRHTALAAACYRDFRICRQPRRLGLQLVRDHFHVVHLSVIATILSRHHPYKFWIWTKKYELKPERNRLIIN